MKKQILQRSYLARMTKNDIIDRYLTLQEEISNTQSVKNLKGAASKTFEGWVIKNGNDYYTGKAASLWSENFLCAKYFYTKEKAEKELEKKSELIMYYNAELPNPEIKKVCVSFMEIVDSNDC